MDGCFRCATKEEPEVLKCVPLVIPCSNSFCSDCLQRLLRVSCGSCENDSKKREQMMTSLNSVLTSLTENQVDVAKRTTTTLPSPFIPEKDRFTAFISTLRSWDEFYVQRIGDTQTLDNLQTKLRKLYNGGNAHELEEEVKLESLEVGQIIVVRYSVDNDWYRARILKKDANSILVQFVDYGDKESVDINSKDRIKNLNPCLKKIPILAIRCSLAGVNPKNEEEENLINFDFEEYFKYMENNFIEVEVARKSLRAKRQNVLEVYLRFSPNEDVKNDVQFDFTDILRINGYLTNEKMDDTPPSRRKSVRFSTIQQPKLEAQNIEENDVREVTISHVNAWDSFYVQYEQDKVKLIEMQRQLQEFYSESINWSRLRIGTDLVRGQLVAAYYEKDGLYRARVLDTRLLKDSQKVQVFFIDYGNTAIIHINKIFKLVDRFFDYPEFALTCKLNWKYDDAEEDRERMNAKFNELVDVRSNFTIRVEEKIGRNMVVVDLFIRMMKNHESVSTAIENLLKCQTTSVIRDQQNSDTEASSSPPVENDFVSRQRFTGGKGKSDEFIVTHAVDPSEIYVRNFEMNQNFEEYQRKIINKDFLPKKIQDDEGEETLYAPGDKVMAFHRNCYNRAVVLKSWRNSEINYCKIRLLDTGVTFEEIESRRLRRMPEELLKHTAFCIPVYLSGIKPAGGTKSWSGTASEALKVQLNSTSSIFLSWIGNKEDGSDRVTMEDEKMSKYKTRIKMKAVVKEDPFGPAEESYENLAHILVDKGLALKTRTKQCEGELPREYDEYSNPSTDAEVIDSVDFPKVEAKKKFFEWPRPVLDPEKRKFQGTITYIDDEAQIYVKPVDVAEACTAMEMELKQAYEDVKLTPEEIGHWEVGEPVIARYPDDPDLLFRGVVAKEQKIAATHDTGGQLTLIVFVIFVDYGEGKCLFPSKGDLFKVKAGITPKSALTNPIFCRRCVLDEVYPKTGYYYERPLLDKLHGFIVDKIVEVTVTICDDSEEKFPLPVIIKTTHTTPIVDLARFFFQISEGRLEQCASGPWVSETVKIKREKAAFHIQPKTTE